MNAQVKLLCDAVCEHFGIGVDQLVAKDRHKSLVFARQLAMYLTRETLGLSYPEIGRAFDRDHSTVMHGVRKASNADPAKAHCRAILAILQRAA